MTSPLQRLHQTKFTLLAVVSTFVGIAVLVVARWAESQPSWAWVSRLPVTGIGEGLFTAGLFGVLFQYVGQRDAEEHNLQRTRSVIADDFATKPDGLAAMVSPEMRDRIIQNCLGIQLGDQALAAEAYQDLRDQVLGAPERWYDVNVSIALTPWEKGPASGRGSMFVATVRYEYRVVPSSPVMRFSCTSDLHEYREQLQDPTITKAWYFEKLVGIANGASLDVFDLAQFSVDGKPRTSRRTTKVGSQVFTINLGAEMVSEKREVTIAYTYRALVQRNGHLFNLDIARPARGLTVRFAYGNCGIRHANVVDYIASSRQPRVSLLPATDPTPSIEVGFDGWVFPKAGVAFVWVLDEEMAPSPKS